LLTQEKYDVILLEGLYMSPYLPLIRKYSNAVVSLKAHNVEHEIWKRVASNESNLLRRKYLKILARRIKRMEIGTLNKNDNIITFTDRDAQFFNSIGNRTPYHVAPAGIDTSHLIPDRTDIKFPSLFFIGALDWAPNQEGLIWFIRNVWVKLKDKYPEIKLEVAGRNAPDWLIKMLNDPSIEFHGEIQDAYAFMNSRAVMIVPLLSGSGMRIKIVEGMALGKAIVTTSVGTEGIETTHNQNILISDTAEQYLKQVEKLITDKALCESIGVNANKFIKSNFDISQISKSLIDFLKRQIEHN
jgi:glycosyltransferase involved in cell wall biosynthesis